MPPLITHLAGITGSMVAPAPRIDAVLPALVELVGEAVVVGHNVAFDLRFLTAALVREEVRDCRLGTLADHFRLAHRPSHRALDDALATGDLLHVLLERAASWGVLALERTAPRFRVVEADAGLAWPAVRLPAFEPGTRLAS